MKVELKDIKVAHERIKDRILRTRLEHSRSCSRLLGTDTYLKFENEQITGSFKIRGALNKILSLDKSQVKRGIVAASAGNHAQGVAYSATQVEQKAQIVMPVHSPLVKVMATQGYGADVILHGEVYDESYHHALYLAQQSGATFIHPFEDPAVIGGQGTMALEILEDLPDIDSLIVGVGGGGVIAGVATVIKAVRPSCRIYGVVPEAFSGMKSLLEGRPVPAPGARSTIAEGTAVKRPSPVMFSHFIEPLVDEIVSVSDDEIACAIVFLLERAKAVVEGAGALPLAAATLGGLNLGRKCCLLLTGGNIDMNLLSKIIERGLSQEGRIARVSVIAQDLPGTLHKLTQVIADQNANILEVEHDRLAGQLQVRETAVDFLLETKSRQHLQRVIDALKAAGVVVRSY